MTTQTTTQPKVDVSPDYQDYDEMPYESYAYPLSRPGNLYSLAKLFKINAPDFSKCRVLELGCASGGNMIPFALDYPEATFVGVDFSANQVEEGKGKIEALGLKNVTLHHMSISDVTKELGQFDYIIAHGVYSWVPNDVQEKILQICGEQLSDNGIAYISYNTLPGWNMIQTIRDMMMYHTANFKTLKEKATQARLLLNFIKDGFKGDTDKVYSSLIEREAELLKNQKDNYLVHDHLNRHNYPCYFYQFTDLAAKHGLDYVSDIDISKMFVGNLPQNVSSVLAGIKGNIIRTEQYLDFLNNRRFRSSLLCKKGTSLSRALNANDIEPFYISAAVSKDAENRFTIQAFSRLNISVGENIGNVMAEILQAQAGKPILAKDLVTQAIKKLTDKADKKVKPSTAPLEKNAYAILLELLLKGGIMISSEAGNYVTEVSKQPQASKLALFQVKSQEWVIGQRYDKIQLDLVGRLVLALCDGQHTVKQIEEELVKHVGKGEITVRKGDVVVKEKKEIEAQINQSVKVILEQLAKRALLVA